jgi:rubrerythrin
MQIPTNTTTRLGFLTRSGALAAGVAAGGALTVGVAGADTDSDLANARLVLGAERLAVTFYTRWLAATSDPTLRPLLLALRTEEEVHSRALAAVIGPTAPVDADFRFVLRAATLHSPSSALDLAADLERTFAGIAIGAAGSTGDPGLRTLFARLAASEGAHLAALQGRRGRPLTHALPEPLDLQGASDALGPYLQ